MKIFERSILRLLKTMMRQHLLLPTFMTLLAIGAAPTIVSASFTIEESKAILGKRMPNLTFSDANGKSRSLRDFRDCKAFVIVFLSFDCPVSNSYSPTLNKIQEDFGGYGVQIIALTTNQDQSPKEIEKLRQQFRLSFPVFLDKNLKAADALRANVTPEVFVLDQNLLLRYRGRIDNAFYARLKRNHEVSAHNLHQVIGELLSGRPVSENYTDPIGCDIQRDLDNIPSTGPITYYRDVLPILQNRCQSCHRPDEVGPFSLLTYRQALTWSDDIKTFTQNGFMPPWKATDGGPFHNDRRLTKAEKEILAKWVDGRSPMGDPKDAPPAKEFPKGWQLGQPDLVITMPRPFELGASGHDVFRCFVLPTNLPEDVYVTALEVRPGNPNIVHHALMFVDTNQQGRKLEEKEKLEARTNSSGHHRYLTPEDSGPGYSVAMGVGFVAQGTLGGWAPGSIARRLPQGHGYLLPAKSDVILQVHYHRNGRKEKDQTKIGLYFANKEETRPLKGHILAGGDPNKGPFPFFLQFKIPAGSKQYKLTGDSYATHDCTIYDITPHMHLLGKSIRVTLYGPDGKKERVLVEVDDWDYNWQETFQFVDPVEIRKGSRLHVEAIYDNSKENRNNPNNPPQDVRFGEQTTNEMCFVFFGGSSDHPGRQLPFSYARPMPLPAQKQSDQ